MKTRCSSHWYELCKSLRNPGYAVKLVGKMRGTSLIWDLDECFIYYEKMVSISLLEVKWK